MRYCCQKCSYWEIYMNKISRLEWLKKQSDNLSESENRLCLRIQNIIRLRAEIDDEIEQLQKELHR